MACFVLILFHAFPSTAMAGSEKSFTRKVVPKQINTTMDYFWKKPRAAGKCTEACNGELSFKVQWIYLTILQVMAVTNTK
jgi:hypothetical protein